MSEEKSVSSEQLPVSSEEEVEKFKEINERQAAEIEALKSQVDQLQNTAKQSLTVPPVKTQGVKPPRDNGVGVLQSAAKKAAASNSRTDVQEYMRLRRNFV